MFVFILVIFTRSTLHPLTDLNNKGHPPLEEGRSSGREAAGHSGRPQGVAIVTLPTSLRRAQCPLLCTPTAERRVTWKNLEASRPAPTLGLWKPAATCPGGPPGHCCGRLDPAPGDKCPFRQAARQGQLVPAVPGCVHDCGPASSTTCKHGDHGNWSPWAGPWTQTDSPPGQGLPCGPPHLEHTPQTSPAWMAAIRQFDAQRLGGPPHPPAGAGGREGGVAPHQVSVTGVPPLGKRRLTERSNNSPNSKAQPLPQPCPGSALFQGPASPPLGLSPPLHPSFLLPLQLRLLHLSGVLQSHSLSGRRRLGATRTPHCLGYFVFFVFVFLDLPHPYSWQRLCRPR